MFNRLLATLALACAIGCGDNSKECGPGTQDEGGTCVPAAGCGFGTTRDDQTGECIPDGNVVCSEGTLFDPLTGMCKIDPSACQNGTVLINNQCADPTAGLTIDVQEGPEPNGLGVVEASSAQAGNVALKPAGSSFVIRGRLAPHRDDNNDGAMDPDVDTFVINTAGPALVSITADGVQGITAGFVAIAAVEPGDALAGWRRFGINAIGDTSKRQVYLPKAGVYRLAIGDARTLDDYRQSGTSTTSSPPGDYYISLTDLGPPSATAISGNTVSSTVDAETVQFYAVPMGTGLNAVSLVMPSDLALASVVVANNGAFKDYADETAQPARVVAGGISSGDTTLVAVDNVFNLSPSPAAFTLTITPSNATPLSTTGGTVSAPPGLFSFEVGAANASLAMQLAFSPSIAGQIYDDIGQRAAVFTAPTTGANWSSFRGIVRLAKPGRYYFSVTAGAANVSATSTLAELTDQTIEMSNPLVTGVTFARVNPFTYDASQASWQQFDVRGTNTGGQTVQWFDPDTAFGRLDPLSTNGGTLASEVAPIFSHAFAAAGGAFGRVLLDDATTTYYVKTTATNPTTSPTLVLDFQPRAAAEDLGPIATSLMKTGETIDVATPQRFYLFRAPAGKSVTITVTATSAVNTQFRRLRADETALGALINNNTGPDVETFTQPAAGWTAFVVSSSGTLSAARTFDLAVTVQ